MTEKKSALILVIEDERSFCDTVREFLEECGYRVLTAGDGQEGLDIYERRKPDLVLLDLRMPEVDGLDVLGVIREQSPDLPIIILSGQGGTRDAVEALQLGAWDYLFKPVEDLLIVQHAVEYALERARLRRQNANYQEHLQEEVDRRMMELEEANRALKESEADYRLLVENQGDMIVKFDPDHRLLFVSPSYCKNLGKEPGELLDESFLPFIHPDDRDRVTAALKNLHKPPYTVHLEQRCRTVEGRRWQEWFNTAVRNDAGEVTAVVAVGRDITKRKETENALVESEAKFRTFAESAHVGVLIYQDDKWIYANPAAVNTLGYPLEELLAMELTDFIHDDYRDLVAERGKARQRGEFPENRYEVKVVTKEGAEKWMDLHAERIDYGGKPAVLISAMDITVRKQAEEELRESEEKYRILTESMKDVAFSVSPAGILKDVSTVIREFGGYEPEEEIGKHISKYFGKKSELLKGLKLIKRVLLDREGASFEFLYKPKEGEPFPVEVTGKPLHRKDGSVSIQCSMRDIRERKQGEQDRLKLQEQLRQAQKMEAIGTLSGGVAHDFNNLLTVIKGHAEIGLMKLESEHEVTEDLEAILMAGNRAESLTRQLLTFSRKQVFEPRVLSINDVIRGLEEMLRRLISEDIRLTLHLDPEIPFIKADPGQIEQVLMNLVVNARDAIREHEDPAAVKQITVETKTIHLDKSYVATHPESRKGLHLLLAVSDSGVGMDSDTRMKIFEPFFTTKTKEKGTGLGLSTVYGIVKQNKGNIDAYSEPGHGTSIKIYWPSTRRKVEKEAAAKPQKDSIRGSETILLVEDDDTVRQITRSTLERLGYTVFEASNGRKAIDLINEKDLQFDLLLTDLIMPEMNGMELAEWVTEMFPSIEILYASGYTDTHLADAGSLDEGIHFIHKPFSVNALAKKVREVLEDW